VKLEFTILELAAKVVVKGAHPDMVRAENAGDGFGCTTIVTVSIS
jgi:hypothetical protein